MKLRAIFLILTFVALLPELASANTCHVGALAGPSFLDSAYGNQIAVGGHAGCQLNPHLTLGLYGTFESLNAPLNPDGSASGVTGMMETFLAAEAKFHPVGDFPLFIGLKLGLGSISSGSNPGAGSASNNLSNYFGFGPSAGFLFRLHERFGFGLEGNYILLNTPGDFTKALNALLSLDIYF